MALLKFKKGLVANLPTEKTEGSVYITTDSQEMMVDISASERIKISDFVIVENQSALIALGTYHENLFYYVKADNLLKRYIAAGETHWVDINSTADVTADVAALGVRLTTAEGNIETLQAKDTALETKIDGINASNVETTEKITVTTPVGNFTKGQEINPDNLQQILLDMLCKDVNPTVTQPSISMTLASAGAKEVGTKITAPSYTLNTNAGSYVANGKTQATGVTFSAYSVTESGRPTGQGTADTKDTKTGSFADLIVTDGMNYKITGHATHSDGVIPKSYLGKEVPNLQIKSKQLGNVSSSAITGFRPIFYGVSSNTNAINSALVRGLTNTNKAPQGMTLTFKASDGVKRFIIAIPTSSGKKVTKAIITSSMNADATSDYVKQSTTVAVQGASGYTTTQPYDIWIYQPASIAATEVHNVTIG